MKRVGALVVLVVMYGACTSSGPPAGAGTAASSGAQGVGGGGGGGGSSSTATTTVSSSGTGAQAPVADAYRGGLIWIDWTSAAVGGSGLPTGVDDAHKAFVLCVSCHGWDARGLNGGFVRRTSNELRPKPTKDSDLVKNFGQTPWAKVEHSWGADWTDLDDVMPNFGADGGLTLQQMKDAAAFVDHGPKIDAFATLDTSVEPVAYTFVGADTAVGATLYAERCEGCHGADGTADAAVDIGTFLAADGAYSEAFHKLVYGDGTAAKTRASMGDLSGEQARDILAYIQANLGAVFP